MYSEKTPDDGQRNCPKHVEFYSKNKFEKLVHLVGVFFNKNSKIHIFTLTFSINYRVFDMFRTSKCSSSGRLVHAVL